MNCLYTAAILFYIDFLIVGPGAGGCFITGFLYARCTPWGFFKYNWIVAKWCANVGFILFGLLWFVPSLESGRHRRARPAHGVPPGRLKASGRTSGTWSRIWVPPCSSPVCWRCRSSSPGEKLPGPPKPHARMQPQTRQRRSPRNEYDAGGSGGL